MEVEITLDSQGIPHIRAKTRTDALFLQGWVTAHQRIFQMDYMLRQAVGTRAEVYREGFLDDDKTQRIPGLRNIAEQSWARRRTLPVGGRPRPCATRGGRATGESLCARTIPQWNC